MARPKRDIVDENVTKRIPSKRLKTIAKDEEMQAGTIDGKVTKGRPKKIVLVNTDEIIAVNAADAPPPQHEASDDKQTEINSKVTRRKPKEQAVVETTKLKNTPSNPECERQVNQEEKTNDLETAADRKVTRRKPQKQAVADIEENELEVSGELTNAELSINNLKMKPVINDLSISMIPADQEEFFGGAGQVIAIELENFMCHKNLHVKFQTDKYNCFYIVGQNGSGKSAIFAGLNIGLGGKGRSNDRGNSLASYIKEGESLAKTRITLSNVGNNRHPDYNDRIIIERTIRLKSSTFSLKSAKSNSTIAKNISTNKKDLDALLKRFNIELENPLCWLSQDRARQFLQQMKPEKLYEIFMITSELKAVADGHSLTDENFANLKEILLNNGAKQEQKRKQYQDMKMSAAASEKCIVLKKKISNANWLRCWVPLVEIDKEMHGIESQIIKLRKQKRDADGKACERAGEGSRLRSIADRKNLEVAQVSDQFMDAKDTIKTLEKAHRDIDKELVQLTHNLRQKDAKIKGFDREISDTRKILESIMGDADRDVFDENRRTRDKFTKAEQDLEEFEDRKNVMSSKREKIFVERRTKTRELSEAQYKVKLAKYEVKIAQKDAKEAEETAKDHLRRFGAHTTKILELLKVHRNEFSKPPIGPVGMFVKVTDKKWIDPVEFCLKELLDGYIFDNFYDVQVFEKLLPRSGLPVPQNINVVPFSDSKFDIEAAPGLQGYETLSDAVKIDNATVFNFLVDKISIDQVILVEDDEQARELMQKLSSKNVKMVVTLSCSTMYPSTAHQPSRSYTGQKYSANVLVQRKQGQDVFVERIQRAKNEIGIHAASAKKVEAEAKDLNSAFDQINADVEQINKKISENRQVVRKMAGQMTELGRAMASEGVITTTRAMIQEFVDQKLAVQSTHDEDTEFLRCRNQKQESVKAQLEKAIENVHVIGSQVRKMEQELRSSRNDFTDFDDITGQIKFQSVKCKKQIDKLTVKKDDCLVRQRHANKLLTSSIQEYLQPANVTNPPEYSSVPGEEQLLGLIQKCTVEWKKLEKLCGGQAVTREDVIAAKEAMDSAAKEHEQISNLSQNAREAFEKRKKLYLRIMDDLPRRLKEKFCEYMQLRNYSGDLQVDTVNKRIDISVETHSDANEARHQTASSRKKRVVQDLKGLSGGERSYTTACFVMALWTCVDSPFRCLDEFDVFMDMQNRRIIMELLTELARKNRHIQFFFFTPQSISELNCKDVEVFQLKKHVP